MPDYHLAQLNVARMRAPIDSPQLAEFVANLERINALADQAPGFVWRLQSEEGDATALRPFGDDMLVNMSVWEDPESLRNYVYQSAHVEIMRRRGEWFERLEQPYTVLWWLPTGTIPTLEEADERLGQLRQSGPTAAAFSFGKPYPQPETGLEEPKRGSQDA